MIVPTEKLAWRALRTGAGKPMPVATPDAATSWPAGDHRAGLHHGQRWVRATASPGPALIIEPLATTLIIQDEVAKIGTVGEIVITEVP